jgi:hypothetical protein
LAGRPPHEEAVPSDDNNNAEIIIIDLEQLATNPIRIVVLVRAPAPGDDLINNHQPQTSHSSLAAFAPLASSCACSQSVSAESIIA